MPAATAARDSYLSENAPASTNGTREWVEWDSDDPAGTGLDTVAAIRFEQLFGNGTGQIPATAAITSATLTLTVNNAGDAGLAYEAAVDWDDSVTWNTFGPAAGVQSGDYVNLLGAVSGRERHCQFRRYRQSATLAGRPGFQPRLGDTAAEQQRGGIPFQPVRRRSRSAAETHRGVQRGSSRATRSRAVPATRHAVVDRHCVAHKRRH